MNLGESRGEAINFRLYALAKGVSGQSKEELMRTGIWIPVWIENLKLTNSQKKLLAEIVSLHQKGKCFASNQYLSEVLGLKPDTISGMIAFLKKKGLIRQTGFDGRKRFLEPIYASDSNPRQSLERETRITPILLQESVSDSDSNKVPCTLIIENKKETIIEQISFQEKIKGFSKETKMKLLDIFENGGGGLEHLDERILRIWSKISGEERKCLN